MNRAAEILDYISKANDCDVLIIAPMAPPVDKTVTGLRVAINKILDASDVADTLAALRARAATSEEKQPDAAGTFSFGLKDVGRFRVSYMTQRGSKVFSIARIPVVLENLASLCNDPALADRLTQMIANAAGGGALAVLGPSPTRNSAFVYSLLQRINQQQRRLIYCVERALTFLMNHDSSIILQSEVGIDVPSIEEGVRTGMQFSPDIMYVGDIRSPGEMTGVAESMQAGIFTLFSSSSVAADALMGLLIDPHAGIFHRVSHLLRGTVRVAPGSQGKLAIEFAERRDRQRE